MYWQIELIDENPFLCFTFSYETLKIWYKDKEVIERMTKVYLPNRESMIAFCPHLAEVL
jgi:hypothetical protein